MEIAKKEFSKYEDMIENIETLSEQPRWSSLIQVSKRVYFPGTVKHTGEYMLEMQGHPSSYQVLLTSAQTVDHLQEKLSEQKKRIQLLENVRVQLDQRAELLTGSQSKQEVGDSSAKDSLPEEIVSDKGVALRVGEFYEIVEYEDS